MHRLFILIMLSNTEKELIVQIWDKMLPVAEEIGSEALLRYANIGLA